MDYGRKQDEPLHDYAIRLYEGKIEYGLNSESIAELLNKETDSNKKESAWRKYYKAFREGVAYEKEKNADILNEMATLDEKQREIYSERVKLQTLKNEYNASLRKKTRQELFYEQIGSKIKAFEGIIVENTCVDYGDYNAKDYILTIADIHCGSFFELGDNVYNYEICKRRFEVLLEKTIAFIKNNFVPHINIVCLGDCIQGILRKSDLKLNETSVVESVVIVSRLIASFLKELSQYVEIDYYHVPTANHTQTRNLGSERNELKYEDVEFIIGSYITDMVSNIDRIHVHTNYGNDYIEFTVNGFNYIAMHGHTIKSYETALKDLSFHKKKFYEGLFLGHYHAASTNGVSASKDNSLDIETYVCPSFVGTCPYSDGLLKSSAPSCKIFTVDFSEGINAVNKIYLK